MKFIADLHIHSKYSRATAKNLDLEHLYIEAQKKGISLLGTGDSTHPEWFSELKEKLVPDEGGLLKLKPEIEKVCDVSVPEVCRREVRFILESEISSIYKKNDKTRKNHNLVYFPTFEAAERFNAKLDAIGNIKSDGRPILGLDAKILLEILLGTHPDAFMIPAHIWTPWFSLFGSKSGFDSIEECFEDLSDEIFAVETGLSSDPPMNWRVSDLDGITLVSNSDAHSPAKLGREANLFNTDFSYMAIRNALKTGNPEHFKGTIEFFPEEGKYHNDGHRKCNISLSPELSSACGGLCPECGKPLTLGVNYRVHELADRDEGFRPENSHPFQSIIPLDEIVAEITGTGTKAKRVQRCLNTAVSRLGSEFDILCNLSVDEIKSCGIPLLGEAVERVREKKLSIEPGYDGEFGKIHIFTEDEKDELRGQKLLFSFQGTEITDGKKKVKEKVEVFKKKKVKASSKKKVSSSNVLNDRQEKAVLHDGCPLLIIAGPGTGKTHTITQKIVRMIREKNISPESIMAITFTKKAAEEMSSRIAKLAESEKGSKTPFVSTFHSLCYTLLRESSGSSFNEFSIADEDTRKAVLEKAILPEIRKDAAVSFKKLSKMIELAKQQLLSPEDENAHVVNPEHSKMFYRVYSNYNKLLIEARLFDFEDLIFQCVKLLETDTGFLNEARERFRHIFVDEYQDLNFGQYRLIKALSAHTKDICVIGDPDQAIYGFRGSDPSYFNRFKEDFPDAEIITLNQNYRSTETILSASAQVIEIQQSPHGREKLWSGIEGEKTIKLLSNASEKAEATAIGKIIESMIGGTGFHSIDFGKTDGSSDRELGFSDFAVLVRTSSLAETMCEAFEKGGIPYQYVSKDSVFRQKAVIDLISLLKQLNGKHLFDREIKRNTELTVSTHGSNDAAFDVYKNDAGIMEIQEQLLYLQQHVPGIREKIGSSKKAEEAFYKLLKLSSLFDRDIDDFLATVALHSDADLYDKSVEKVAVMTMHASKGLEFPVVFVPGCENGIVPFIKSGKGESDPDEERRLFYVAMTRARESLILSYTEKRIIFGKKESREKSFFLNDIDDAFIRNETPAFGNIEKTRKPVQMTLF